MLLTVRKLSIVLALTGGLAAGLVAADTPLGWINSSNNAAYTTARGDLEISIAGLAVNDSLDFFNIRDDLIANNRRLAGDSGDLSGEKLELHYGVFEEFSVFYKRQQHSLTVDLGTISSINLIDCTPPAPVGHNHLIA